MIGENWLVHEWRIMIGEWPSADEWGPFVATLLKRVRDLGAPIAWMATDHTFADPPSLFDPAVMGDGVYAASSDATGSVCSASVGRPLEFLPAEVQAALRAQASWLTADGRSREAQEARLLALIDLLDGRIDPSAIDIARRNVVHHGEYGLAVDVLAFHLLGDRRIERETANAVLVIVHDLGMSDVDDVVELRDWLDARDGRLERSTILHRTPLHYAALEGDVNETTRLLTSGADPTARDIHGTTALHLAAKRGSVPIATLLLEHGAPVDAVEHDRRTPLHNAVDHDLELIRLLLSHGADPGFGVARIQTPLGRARLLNQSEAVALLEAEMARRHEG